MIESKYTLTQRIAKADDLHRQGYNCAQCVALVFDDVTNLDSNVVAKMMAAFGSGLSTKRLTCGAISALAAVNSLMKYNTVNDKQPVYKSTLEMVDEFERQNGSAVCGQLLKSPSRKPCRLYIADAITLLHNNLFC